MVNTKPHPWPKIFLCSSDLFGFLGVKIVYIFFSEHFSMFFGFVPDFGVLRSSTPFSLSKRSTSRVPRYISIIYVFEPRKTTIITQKGWERRLTYISTDPTFCLPSPRYSPCQTLYPILLRTPVFVPIRNGGIRKNERNQIRMF